MKTGKSEQAMTAVIYALLVALSFATFYPFWNAVVISLNSGLDTSMGGVTLWPREFTLDNYRLVFEDGRLPRAFLVSVIRVLAGTAISVFFTSLLGYGLSRRGVVFHRGYMVFCVATMFFSGGLIPSFLLVRSLGMMDTLWALILPPALNVFHMIIFRTFFMTLPDGLEEAAKIDGCNQLAIYFRIALPLSGPVLATLSLFSAVYHWNDWFTATIYINNPKLLPLSGMLQQMLNSNLAQEMLMQTAGSNAAALDAFNRMMTVTSKSLSMASMVVATLPIILVYPFLQRYFVKGVLIGSLKG